MKTIKLALLGHGTVGQAVHQIIEKEAKRLTDQVEARTGQAVQLELVGVLVKHPEKHQLGSLGTTEVDQLLTKDYDILIELIGGTQPATDYMIRALEQGKPVVTANKQALFKAQGKLEAVAKQRGTELAYEAAVAGAIPILRSLRSLASGRVTKLQGIVNGSTNYILTRVSQGLSLAEAQQEAFQKGYLEADPTSDVEGYDALYKLGIMTYLVTGAYPSESQIERIGISQLSQEQIGQAKNNGLKYKLVAEADFLNQTYSVKPQALPADHYLYQVDQAMNGINLWHEYAGQLAFAGPGAGGNETATAVIGNLIDIICQQVRLNQ